MDLLPTIDGLRAELDAHRKKGRTVGLVPTMGALHKGHLSLVARAREECDVVVLSLFVNPLQFAAHEDLDRYPRPFEADRVAAADAGVDLLFHPSVGEMYPHGPVITTVSAGMLGSKWEGITRPTHFDGMATVVAKLFNIAGPCRAYFGEKDWQQLTIVRAMAEGLSFPVQLVGCPIIRERDGLALSSRNIYLSTDERFAALGLSHALAAGLAAIGAGKRNPDEVHNAMFEVLTANPLVEPSYVGVVNEQLEVPDSLFGSLRLLVAGNVGATHLIDNVAVTVPSD